MIAETGLDAGPPRVCDELPYCSLLRLLYITLLYLLYFYYLTFTAQFIEQGLDLTRVPAFGTSCFTLLYFTLLTLLSLLGAVHRARPGLDARACVWDELSHDARQHYIQLRLYRNGPLLDKREARRGFSQQVPLYFTLLRHVTVLCLAESAPRFQSTGPTLLYFTSSRYCTLLGGKRAEASVNRSSRREKGQKKNRKKMKKEQTHLCLDAPTGH